MFYHLSFNGQWSTSYVFQELRHFPFPADVSRIHRPFRDFATSLSRHQQSVLTRSATLLDSNPVWVLGKVRFYDFSSCHNLISLKLILNIYSLVSSLLEVRLCSVSKIDL